MNKDIFALGLVILIVGLFLTLAFWPLFGVSGRELADDQDGTEYESYAEGDTVLVYGTVTEVNEYPDIIGDILEELVGGVPVEIDDNLIIILANQNSTDLEVGDEVYGRVTLNEESGIIQDFEFWVHDGDLRSKTVLDYASYGLVGAGVAVTVVGVVKD